jgi:serine/threonine-protein kinase
VGKAKEKERDGEELPRHKKIGAYRVLSAVGRGGMAVVYRGIHESLQREVAIKELLPAAVLDKEAKSRFHREALALAAFRHQNIVTLYDLVEKNDSLFMVMEFVDGPTLQALLREGPLPVPVAAVVGARVASALDHAHFNRIIHRDIKPANIMLTKAGEVKLMDFGIAKDEALLTLTQHGMAVGTPSYMSPEQVKGQPLDPRTDLFSLGVVLYEMLSGQRPFSGQSTSEVFAKIRDGKYPPLEKLKPDVPGPLRKLVRRALKGRLDRRYQDAAKIRGELELFLAKEVRCSHQALLVAFLQQRKLLTETELRARLNERELTLLSSWGPLHRRRRPWKRWAVAAALLGGALGAFALSEGMGWTHVLSALWTQGF